MDGAVGVGVEVGAAVAVGAVVGVEPPSPHATPTNTRAAMPIVATRPLFTFMVVFSSEPPEGPVHMVRLLRRASLVLDGALLSRLAPVLQLRPRFGMVGIVEAGKAMSTAKLVLRSRL